MMLAWRVGAQPVEVTFQSDRRVDAVWLRQQRYLPESDGSFRLPLSSPQNFERLVEVTAYAGDRSQIVQLDSTSNPQKVKIYFPSSSGWKATFALLAFLGVVAAFVFRRRGARPPVDPTDPWVGQKVGGYLLLNRLGQGGMATVYRARRGEQVVALKRIHPGQNSEEFRRRFDREIQVSLQLEHPHLVRLIDANSSDPAFLAMELVPGKTLRELLPELGFSLEQVLEYARQLCLGLAYAHQRGVVHRDLKPDNVLVNPNGQVKIADFGLARSQEVQTVTVTGQAVGTPHYMPPEQVSDKISTAQLDPRSDQYALAAMLFEMLTGRPVFDGMNVVSVITQHLTRPAPAIRELRPEVPEALDAALQRALSKDPSQRFATIEAFSEALQACQNRS